MLSGHHHFCVTLDCPSFLWSLLYMCVLHCSEVKRVVSISGLPAVESLHLAHSHWHPLGDRQYCWGCCTPGTLSEPPSTDVAWHSRFITICVKNEFRYFTGPQQPWPLASSTHYVTTHTNFILRTEKNNKLSMQHCGCKPSLKFEEWNAMSRAQNGALQSKRMADKSLLLAACQRIIIKTVAVWLHSPDQTISRTQPTWREQEK